MDFDATNLTAIQDHKLIDLNKGAVGHMRNVILLTIDTLRRDALGIYGSKRGLSPFIDSIADRCVVFDRAQAIGPYTQTSFPGILTSSYYFDYGRSSHLSPQRVLVSEPLKSGGIVTAAFHSNPYVSDYFGWNRGWDVFRDFMEYEVSDKVPFLRGKDVNSHVKDWLSSHVKGNNYQSFFLWVHYMDVHEPYIPQREYLELAHSSTEAHALSEDDMFQLFKEVVLKRDISDRQKVALLKELYEARVREVDDYVKQFFGILEQLEVLEDCLVIVTSDHGDEFGEHGGLSHDGKMFQELVSVPLFVFDPERRQRETCDKVVSSVDIPPTINCLFGLEPVQAFQGQSLFPLSEYKERGCFGEAIEKLGHSIKETDKEVYYYLAGNLKIIYRGNIDAWEMYDLQNDPNEINNIIPTVPKEEEMTCEQAHMKAILKARIGRWKET